ncbi:MAG: hypothetical protein ABH842_00445 [Candidatus Micrarchaeota archaeon]
MKLYVVLLMMISLTMAFTVKPSYIDTKNTGDPNLGELEIELTVDCSNKQLTAFITNEDEEPIADAKTYVFYTDYGYQLLGTGTTDNGGISTINVIGNMDYLSALFIFRADATGYQSQEIEFTYMKCFGAPPQEPDPPEDPVVPPTIPEDPPAQTNISQNLSQNITQNNTTPYQPPTNNTVPYQPPVQPRPETGFCPVALGLLLLAYKVR